MGMSLQKGLDGAFAVQYDRDPAAGCVSDGDVLFQAAVEIFDAVPVVEAEELPAEFPAAVEQEDLAQEFADLPAVVFGFVGAHGQGHSFAPEMDLCSWVLMDATRRIVADRRNYGSGPGGALAAGEGCMQRG